MAASSLRGPGVFLEVLNRRMKGINAGIEELETVRISLSDRRSVSIEGDNLWD